MTTPRIPLVYVAGPYAATTRWEEEQNVRHAEAVGYNVADAGAMPVIPHTNTRPHFSDLNSAEWWYEATVELMRRCDAVMMVPGWKQSKGSVAERTEAERIGLPVFLTLRELTEWIDGRNGCKDGGQ